MEIDKIKDIIFDIGFENNIIKTIIPNNDSSNIEPEYLDTDLFLVALQAILPQLSSNVFIPDLSHGDDYFIKINLIEKTVQSSTFLTDVINNNFDKYDIFIIPIQLTLPVTKYNYSIVPNTEETDLDTDLRTGHANFIIIDKLKLNIEFFEPHGIFIFDPISIFNYQIHLQNHLNSIFPHLFLYSFINSANTCFVGVQSVQNTVNNQGSCLGWTLYMIFMRIINENLNITTSESISEYIHRYMTSFYSANELHIIINKFMTYVTLIYIDYLHLHKSFNHNIVHKMRINVETVINDRLTKLIKLYLYKLSNNSFGDCNSIFVELYSYITYPIFHKIFAKELRNYTLNSYFKQSLIDILKI